MINQLKRFIDNFKKKHTESQHDKLIRHLKRTPDIDIILEDITNSWRSDFKFQQYLDNEKYIIESHGWTCEEYGIEYNKRRLERNDRIK